MCANVQKGIRTGKGLVDATKYKFAANVKAFKKKKLK